MHNIENISIGLKKDLLYQKLQDDIANKKYQLGEKLPNEVEFAKELNVGRITLRNALHRLEREGVIVKVPRKGTFIAVEPVKRKKFLAVLPENAGFPVNWHEMLPGLELHAEKCNVIIEKCSAAFLYSMPMDVGIKQLQSHNLDGIFYMGNNIKGDEKDFLMLKGTGLPIVIPQARESDYFSSGCAILYISDHIAWKSGVEYLASQGHYNIASVINWNPSKLCHGFSKESYADFLSELDCNPSPDLVKDCIYDYDTIVDVVKNLMASNDVPTAIVCYSDLYALYVCRALNQLKIKIPQQVAVMGYGGHQGGIFAAPPLSTIDLGYHERGKAALNLMLKADSWFRSDTAPPKMCMQHRLIERGSTKIRRLEKELCIA